jgi:uncharacterized SAM-binding protein YcdF (DUF218 family)
MPFGQDDPRYQALERAAARDAAAKRAVVQHTGWRGVAQRLWARLWLRSLLIVLVLGTTSLALFLDLYGHEPRAVGFADAIVVLGAGVEPDGTASQTLQERTRHGVRLLQEGVAPLLLTTGGADPGEPSEARAAGDFALSLGIDATALVLEEHSKSTWQNAQFSAPLLRARGVKSVVVVSDPYHVWRGKKNLEAQGFVVTASASPYLEERFGWLAYGLRPLWALREVISVSRDVVFFRYL